MKKISTSEKDTFGIAKAFAGTLKGGETIVLSGELGAGKTVFVKGLAAGLGITDEIVSPTFALFNEYSGRLGLCHFDVYRLSSGREAYEAGLTEQFGRQDCVSCIEWGENIASVLPADAIEVKITYLGDGKREIEIADK